jgi:hypothetical protein
MLVYDDSESHTRRYRGDPPELAVEGQLMEVAVRSLRKACGAADVSHNVSRCRRTNSRRCSSLIHFLEKSAYSSLFWCCKPSFVPVQTSAAVIDDELPLWLHP